MKKLFTLLTMLLIGIGSMWGQTNPSVISINFASDQTNGNFSGTGGLVPVANWNNLTGTSGSNYDLKKSDNTSSGATVTFSCKNTWTYNSNSNIKDNWLVGYLDDGNEISIDVSNIPYTKYSLIIYQATDTEGYGFNPPSINGTYYSWDGSKTSETRNDTELKYGSSRNKYAMLGVNTMYLKNFTNNTLTIRGGGNTNSARGCIAAIQIVEEVDGNTLYPSSATQITSATSLTASKYYLIEGKDQSDNWYYLYDNGTKIQGALLNRQEIGKYVWQLIGKDNAWVLKNIGTGKYMSLGSSDGSQISSSDKAQINSLYFAADGNATIRNSNGQAIDMTANGLTPTTWTGNQTPEDSRSLHLYETNLFATDLEAYKSSITYKVDLQKNVSVLFSDDDYTTYTTSVESATSVAEADEAYATFMASPGTDIFAVSSRFRGEGAPHYIKMSSQTTINKSEKVTNNTVYQLTHIGDGNYLFYNSKTNGYWGKMTTRNGAIPGAADVINAGFYRVEWNSTDNGRGDHINLKNINTTTGYFYVHESAEDWVVDWNANADASKWTIEAAASRSDILEGYNTYVGLLTNISESEWKTADYWRLADGVTWKSDGPGYSMWQPIYLNGITASGIAFDGWNLSLKLVNSHLTAKTTKIQTEGTLTIDVDEESTLDLTLTSSNNNDGTHIFNIYGALTINMGENDWNNFNSTNTINLGTTGNFTFTSNSKTIPGNVSFTISATLADPTEDNKVQSRILATFNTTTVTTLSTIISGTDGWTKATSLKDLKAQTSDGKYYYVEESSSTGVILYTYKLNAPVEVNSGAITVDAEITSGVVSLINTAIVNNNATSVDLTGTTTTEITGLVVPANCLVIVNDGTTVKDGNDEDIENNVVVKDGKDYSCENLVLTDKVPFKAPVEFTATSITHKRKTSSTSAVWGTACLPYPVQSVSGEGDGIRYYQLSESNSNDGVMSFTLITEEIAANTPVVFIKSSSADFNFNATGKNVKVTPANPEASAAQNLTLVGTFAGSDDVATDENTDYFYISGNKFWRATGTLKVSPFRAYFTSPNGVLSARNFTLQVVDNGTITRIDSVDGIDVSNVSDEHVYTLEGKKVNNVKKGSIYIIGGNKVVIK